ncbi:hypothetical protein KIPB_002504 [Kipferlia bialata]|uniref:Uncharacterized protein n=1 Tax=Kipferlia bialata TaxID=797122 RepID=A0A391NSI5_9EUKA|nr:hypothetical protein KIPB_002504 [Kipferlia bialata]|eukprot:g2504.t1
MSELGASYGGRLEMEPGTRKAVLPPFQAQIDKSVGDAMEEVLGGVIGCLTQRPLFVILEPALYCNAATDHTTPKDISPLYRPDIVSLLGEVSKELRHEVVSAVASEVGTRTADLTQALAQCRQCCQTTESELSTALASIRRMETSLAVRDTELANCRERYYTDTSTLKEQLFQRARLGEHFKPDALFGKPEASAQEASGEEGPGVLELKREILEYKKVGGCDFLSAPMYYRVTPS